MSAEHASEAEHEAIVTALSDGVALIAADGVIRTLNPSAERLLGVRAEQVVGRRLLDWAWRARRDDGTELPREDHPALIALRTGEPRREELLAVRRADDGRLVWLSVSATPLVRDGETRPYAVVSSFRDVSEVRAADAALRHRQRRLELLNDIAAGITAGEPVDAIVGRAVRTLAGFFPRYRVAYSTIEPAGVLTVRVRAQADGAGGPTGDRLNLMALAPAYLRALRTDVVVVAPDTAADPRFAPFAEMLAASGTRAAAAAPLRLDQGIVGLISLTAAEPTRWDDETLTTIAEVAGQLGVAVRHARATRALEESERRFRGILENLRAVAVNLDLEGNVTFCNDYLLELTGWTRDEVIGQSWFERFVPAGSEATGLFYHMLARGEIEPHYENDILTRAGARRTISWDNAVLRDDDGRVVGVASIGQDVTEWRAVDRRKSEFVSTVSHELRTPLTSIRGALGLVEGGVAGELPARAGSLVGIARSNADRLIRLVNDVLDLDKMESGKMELAMARLDPADLVRAAVDGVSGMAAERRVEVRARPHAGDGAAMPAVLGDRDRLIQVLTNFLSNAIRFSPQHGTVVASAAAGDGDGRVVRLSVEDHGPGIPPEGVERLFQKFGQLAGSAGGTGLGLAISKAIVAQHGGQVGVESEPGRRTVFWCELPAADDA